jgi:hypothetical protein
VEVLRTEMFLSSFLPFFWSVLTQTKLHRDYWVVLLPSTNLHKGTGKWQNGVAKDNVRVHNKDQITGEKGNHRCSLLVGSIEEIKRGIRIQRF